MTWWPRDPQRRAKWQLSATTLTALLLRFIGLGWGGLFYWYAYALVTALHVGTNRLAINAAGAAVGRIRLPLVVSQLLFLLGMLLQFDGFDGPVWIVGPALIGLDLDLAPLAPYANYMQLWNMLAFLPCAVSWVVILRASRRFRQTG